MARKPKPERAAPAAPAAPAPGHARPHVDFAALPAAILLQATDPKPLLVYREGNLIGALLPIDAGRWQGERDGEIASIDLEVSARRVGRDLARDWYAHNFDARLGAEAIARQIEHSNRKFRIDPQGTKPK